MYWNLGFKLMKKLAIAFFLLLSASWSLALSEGDSAPLFKAKSLTGGNVVELRSFRGKVVYLDFWASWCGPCRKSLPELNKLRAELAGRDFEVVAVNLDENAEDGLGFLKQFPVDYPIAADSSGKLPEAYGVEAMPTSYIIDQQGVVRMVHAGYRDGDIAEIKAKVLQLLKK